MQNSKTEFRLAAERKMEEKKKDEEREVKKRQWGDQVKRVELRRMRRDMARRREQTIRLKKFYTAKCEVTNEDNSEDEEDEVLDFTKQKAEIIFWNDPRMGMKKKDITLSSLAKSMGIMTITVTDMEEDKNVKEQHLKLKGNEEEEEVGPLERLKRNGLAEALIRKPQKEKVSLLQCSVVSFCRCARWSAGTRSRTRRPTGSSGPSTSSGDCQPWEAASFVLIFDVRNNLD